MAGRDVYTKANGAVKNINNDAWSFDSAIYTKLNGGSRVVDQIIIKADGDTYQPYRINEGGRLTYYGWRRATAYSQKVVNGGSDANPNSSNASDSPYDMGLYWMPSDVYYFPYTIYPMNDDTGSGKYYGYGDNVAPPYNTAIKLIGGILDNGSSGSLVFGSNYNANETTGSLTITGNKVYGIPSTVVTHYNTYGVYDDDGNYNGYETSYNITGLSGYYFRTDNRIVSEDLPSHISSIVYADSSRLARIRSGTLIAHYYSSLNLVSAYLSLNVDYVVSYPTTWGPIYEYHTKYGNPYDTNSGSLLDYSIFREYI